MRLQSVHNFRKPRKLLLISMVGVLIFSFVSVVYAVSEGTVVLILVGSVIDKLANLKEHFFLPTDEERRIRGEITDRELAKIRRLAQENKANEHAANIPAVGEGLFAGQSLVTTAPGGTEGLLTFRFVDPGSGLPVSVPSLSSVQYVAIDVVTPTSTLMDLVPLGVSNDLSSNFSFPFVTPTPTSLPDSITGAESLILALPFDSNGNLISTIGPEGNNVDIGIVANIAPGVVVPGPSSWLLFCTGLLSLIGYGWRRRKKAA